MSFKHYSSAQEYVSRLELSVYLEAYRGSTRNYLAEDSADFVLTFFFFGIFFMLLISEILESHRELLYG